MDAVETEGLGLVTPEIGDPRPMDLVAMETEGLNLVTIVGG